MTPLTAEKIAELEGLPAKWRAEADSIHSAPYDDSENSNRAIAMHCCADELERLTAPFLSLAKRVAGAPTAKVLMYDNLLCMADASDYKAVRQTLGKRVALVEIVGGEEGNAV
jgi:hypothetical protein